MSFFVDGNELPDIQKILKIFQERKNLHSPIAKNVDFTNLLSKTSSLPLQACDLDAVFEQLQPLLPHLIDVHHPHTAAHLHCPPLKTSVLAELFIAMTNLSMDSWDQSGIATQIEQQVVQWFADMLGYMHADGIFTSGGTQSNVMGVLLAREAYAKKHELRPFNETGITQPLTILCTQKTHFSVTQAARWLGIGSDNVICVDPFHMDKKIIAKNPFVFVATAGCTDFAEIDPLEKIAEICAQFNIWMHVDAAVGGALLLTKEKKRLKGIALSDSVTIDFHKLFFQPISASLFMVREKANFSLLNFYSDYLNRKTDEENGFVNLVGKSMQTTRRFDALKVWLSFQHLGVQTLQMLLEKLLTLTAKTADLIEKDECLFLVKKPSINTIVFGFVGGDETLNRKVRLTLFKAGLAVLGETTYENKIYLKFTLMNPDVSVKDMQRLITLITATGKDIAKKSL
jgi:L-2,4-diaminobutyrate decarboxylase